MPAEINIENIENNIKDRLDLKLAAEITSGIIEVEVMPDTTAGFKRPLKKTGRISICYMDTDFDKPATTDVVSQFEYNRFGFFLASKTRVGPGGVYDLYQLCRKWLIGFKPLNHDRLIAKKSEMHMREVDTGLWFLRFEMSARCLLLEFNDDPAAALISRVQFEPVLGSPGNVVTVDENTDPVNPIE